MKYYNKVLSFALASSLMMTPMSFANEATEVTVDTAAGFTVFNTEETANFIKINDSIVKEPTIEGVREFFNENQAFFQIQNPELELSEISTFTDMQGNTHVKVQQQFNELPVLGKEYIVHFNKDNEIYAANGHLDLSVYDKADKGISRDTKIDGDLAISIARKEIMADSYTDNQEATMYLYENDENYLPIYEVEIATVAPLGEWNVKVDAQTGEVLSASNKLETIQYEGHGAGVDHKLKTLNLDKRDDGKYYLYDDTRNGVVVKTFDMKHNNDEYALPGELIWDEDSVLYGDDKRAAVDAHKYAGFVIDYYKDNFGRNSINNEGMDIVSSVHFDKNYVNAFWWNDQMTYGDGDGVEALALSGALDIVGHEMTHGVTEYTANLVYENQPGALNESMSDVFGTFIEMEYQPEKADYLCGEDVWTPNVEGDALRDLANPENYNQPAHMDDYNHYPIYIDHGGVHSNSGIPNKAAALITKEIGYEKAQDIYYTALTSYLVSTSNFKDAKMSLMQAAEDIFGNGSAEYNSVKNAYDAVGVY